MVRFVKSTPEKETKRKRDAASRQRWFKKGQGRVFFPRRDPVQLGYIRQAGASALGPDLASRQAPSRSRSRVFLGFRPGLRRELGRFGGGVSLALLTSAPSAVGIMRRLCRWCADVVRWMGSSSSIPQQQADANDEDAVGLRDEGMRLFPVAATPYRVAWQPGLIRARLSF